MRLRIVKMGDGIIVDAARPSHHNDTVSSIARQQNRNVTPWMGANHTDRLGLFGQAKYFFGVEKAAHRVKA
jgi:hypothetical protein